MAKIDDATFSTKDRVFDPKKDLNTLQGNYFRLLILEAKIEKKNTLK